MSPQDSPTPPAPAEVMERLQLLYDHILDDDCLKDAIAIIEQGEKERERLDWLGKRSRYSGPSWGYHNGYHTITVASPTKWTQATGDISPTTPEDLRQAIDAVREQPTPESK